MITVELYEADFYSLFSIKQVDSILPSVCSVLYNELNTTRSVFGRCLWYIRVQTHGWRHRKIVFNMVRSFENVCKIIPDWAS